MVNLKDFNHAHDGMIIQIDFDFDYGNFERIQEFRIKYAVSIEEEQADGSFKTVGYDYFQMIFSWPQTHIYSQKKYLPFFHFGHQFIYEIVELDSDLDGFLYWQIRMCESNEYIDIYAEDLRIEKITNPFKHDFT